jgi:esterase/lipase superfamily enzyme
MNREYVKIFSKHLGQEFEMLVYGTGGKPIMVFPSQEGRFFDYENFGMIDTIAPFIETQKIQVYCVDGIDHETWFSKAPYSERISRVYDYEKTIINDVVPYILGEGHYGAGIMTHGCSFGAFHAANFLLRHPDVFDLGLALSGCYDIGFAANNFDDFDAFSFSPARYSSSIPADLRDKLKSDLLVLCSGQGPWEEWNEEAKTLAANLKAVRVPVLLDLWGYDVSHDWPWWKKMVVYFLDRLDVICGFHSMHRLTSEKSTEIIDSFSAK